MTLFLDKEVPQFRLMTFLRTRGKLWLKLFFGEIFCLAVTLLEFVLGDASYHWKNGKKLIFFRECEMPHKLQFADVDLNSTTLNRHVGLITPVIIPFLLV